MTFSDWLIQYLVKYRMIFSVLAMLVFGILLWIVAKELYVKIKDYTEYASIGKSKEELLKTGVSNLSPKKANAVLRTLLSTNVDPNPNGYMIISDGGKEIFQRTFTAIVLPRNVDFAKTFYPLLNFENMMYSIYSEPITTEEMIDKFDKQVKVLDAEYDLAAGKDANRKRKIGTQFAETDAWAKEAESSRNSYFKMRFLFTLRAESLKDLNDLSDQFRQEAQRSSVDITSCFGVQSEAFLSNGPFNKRYYPKLAPHGATDCAEGHIVDKYAGAACVFNYFEREFSHKDGAYIGNCLFGSRKPFFFNPHKKGSFGFTTIISGKTGSGKSLLIKVLLKRLKLKKYRFASIDTQTRAGTTEGEFAALAESMGGQNYVVSSKSDNVLNPFAIMPSKKCRRESGSNRLKEYETLELADKITIVTNELMTLIEGENPIDDKQERTYLMSVITDTVKAVYDDFEIYDGEPSSVYEKRNDLINGKITNGQVLKTMPTLSDYMAKQLQREKENKDSTLTNAYRLAFHGLKEYVKELYIVEGSGKRIGREAYLELEKNERGERQLYNKKEDYYESLLVIKGSKPYFDGQSTLAITKEIPYINIDINQLPEKEKKPALLIATDIINEYFIKPNSENPKDAEKLIAVFDEVQQLYKIGPCRVALDLIVRTARKRHVGILLSTQTLAEHDNYEETRGILSQAAFKILFKQEETDRAYLMKNLPLTSTQVDKIIHLDGSSVRDRNGEATAKAKGRCCIIDGDNAAFVQVRYLRRTEQLVADTDASEVAKIFKVAS